jgi:hypothetical protein
LVAPLEKLRYERQMTWNFSYQGIYDKIKAIMGSGLILSYRDFKYCLVCVDICTRFVWLRPLKEKNEKTVAKALLDILFNFGPPKLLQSDNGSEFVNKVI